MVNLKGSTSKPYRNIVDSECVVQIKIYLMTSPCSSQEASEVVCCTRASHRHSPASAGSSLYEGSARIQAREVLGETSADLSLPPTHYELHMLHIVRNLRIASSQDAHRQLNSAKCRALIVCSLNGRTRVFTCFPVNEICLTDVTPEPLSDVSP